MHCKSTYASRHRMPMHRISQIRGEESIPQCENKMSRTCCRKSVDSYLSRLPASAQQSSKLRPFISRTFTSSWEDNPNEVRETIKRVSLISGLPHADPENNQRIPHAAALHFAPGNAIGLLPRLSLRDERISKPCLPQQICPSVLGTN